MNVEGGNTVEEQWGNTNSNALNNRGEDDATPACDAIFSDGASTATGDTHADAGRMPRDLRVIERSENSGNSRTPKMK